MSGVGISVRVSGILSHSSTVGNFTLKLMSKDDSIKPVSVQPEHTDLPEHYTK